MKIVTDVTQKRLVNLLRGILPNEFNENLTWERYHGFDVSTYKYK